MQDKLAGIRAKFSEHLPGKVALFEAALLEALQGDLSREKLDEIVRMAHTLGGTSLSFGFTSIGNPAREIEKILKEEAENDITEDVKARCLYCLEEMKSALTAPESPSSIGMTNIPARVEEDDLKKKKLIYLAEDDRLVRESLSHQLNCFGYEVIAFDRTAELIDEMKERIPSIIIMDIVFPEGEMDGINAAKIIRNELGQKMPIVFVSGRDDFDMRLKAVKAGGNEYIVKPLNLSVLIEKIDALTRDKDMVEPCRVLVVDDDPDLADYHSEILKEAGMHTEVVTNPLDAMGALSRFNPDLILMDVYMPDCNGIELSKILRQIDAHTSIPIVFLSSETNLDMQMTAMSTGGDDFLTKPIRPEHLVSSVRIKAERMRIIRSFMDRDSLTGLLNHTRTKENLDILLERATRAKSPLTFAMIDIDKFKSVNDTYGHPVGDRVIISLSRLLRQCLRRTDVVGRYGGEEFAVILPDTDALSAKNRMDEIRESFADIKHHSDKGEFSVTFSCGVACSQDIRTAINLCNSADTALYKAKDTGRNRIEVAESGR